MTTVSAAPRWAAGESFVDLPGETRMQYRAAVEAAGGDPVGYYDGRLQVAIPSPSGPFFRAMAEIGLRIQPGSLQYFPLGSDKAPDHQRHDGSYPGSRGFWLFANLEPDPSRDPQ